MEISFNVKSRFVVNGKEYGSVEEMPEEVRAAYEQAVKASSGHGRTASHATGKTRIVFNSREYANEDAMPQGERELYTFVRNELERKGIPLPEGIRRNLGIPGPGTRIHVGRGSPIVPGSSFSPRKWFSFPVILVLLLGLVYLLFVSGR